MNKVVQNKMRKFCTLLFSLLCLTVLASGCQKKPAPEELASAPSAPVAEAPKPTGLVKNAVRHTDQTADVTKWMDQAATKTPAQIALEEKQAKEAKLALETKAQAAKAAPNTRDSARAASVAAAPAPQVVMPKVVEAPPASTPVVAASKAAAPAAAPAEQNVLKLLSSTQPNFPGAAARAGLTEGVVNARIHIDTDGKVSHVDIIKAIPSKYFDREVIAAASSWKYAPISSPQTKVLEFHFKLDN
ncbi:MAG: TonB family protein [Pseudomonadota bacterium]